jgi:hypothetical protein
VSEKDFRLVSAHGHSHTTGGKSTRNHLEEGAVTVARELLRRSQAYPGSNVLVQLAETSCRCGSDDPHPNLHWVIAIGGPFQTSEDAARALQEIDPDALLKSDSALRDQRDRLTGSDITGSEQ